MGDTAPHDWQRWRVTVVTRSAAVDPAPDRFVRRIAGLPTEPAGEDGVRHELVARVRAAIEAGTYDTEERWQAAEALLFRAVEGED